MPSSDMSCVNIQLQLLHLLVAGLEGRGRMVIARKSPADLTTLLVRRKKDLSLTFGTKQKKLRQPDLCTFGAKNLKLKLK